MLSASSGFGNELVKTSPTDLSMYSLAALIMARQNDKKTFTFFH